MRNLIKINISKNKLEFLIIPVCITLLTLSIYRPDVIENYEFALFNLCHPVIKGNSPHKEIIVVAIDDISITEIGEWPWNRAILAELLDSICSGEPRLVGYNLYFPKRLTKRNEEQNKIFNIRFAESTEKCAKVMFPYHFGRLLKNKLDIIKPASIPNIVYNSRIKSIQKPKILENFDFLAGEKVFTSEPMFANSGLRTGHGNTLIYNKDINSQFHVVKYGNEYFPSFPLAAAVNYLRCDDYEFILAPGKIILCDSIHIPVDIHGICYIRFNDLKMFQTISAYSLLRESPDKSLLKDKLVLIGLTGKANPDYYYSASIGKNIHQVFLWANSIENIIHNKFIHRFHPYVFIIEFLLLLFLCLPYPIYLKRYSLGRQILFYMISIIALMAMSIALLNTMAIWFKPVYHFIGLSICATCSIVLKINQVESTQNRNSYFSAAPTGPDIFKPVSDIVATHVIHQHLGRYQMQELIGKGSMGEVYKAIDPKINRPVAIKTIRHDISLLSGDTIKERFYQEAHTAGTLSHPNIITVYDMGEEADLTYIVMELLKGRTLKSAINKKGTKDLYKVYNWINQMCNGLSYAHHGGVVHR
ncbi:MAG: serine/threonine-protein kinase, partial [bacterium]